MASSSSSASPNMLQAFPQVLINFGGDELRYNFISHLEKAFGDDGINCFIDSRSDPGDHIESPSQHIEKSKIALVIFSKRYSESTRCLKKLVKIMENVEENKLIVIPIFFNVSADDVKHQMGEFGMNLYGENRRPYRSNLPKWEKALTSVTNTKGLTLGLSWNESKLIVKIVLAVKRLLLSTSPINERGQGTNMFTKNTSSVSSTPNFVSGTIEQPTRDLALSGVEQRVHQFEEMFLWMCS